MDKKPWTEAYRPTEFENIVLDPLNQRFFESILNKDYFPNMLFYGPPGTGKTTTIINLINEYQIRYNKKSKSTIIHLNASDERGIDIIRNQIYQFVKSKHLFETGLKFVILDEVDYMTKTAQQALKHLLQSACYNVRFCLICNYISKIDDSLQKEFITIRFNQLPKAAICAFIKTICEKENVQVEDADIESIQSAYQSDVRSMINFIQLNQNLTRNWKQIVLDTTVFENIHTICKESDCRLYINELSIQYNMDKKSIITKYFSYVIMTYPELVTVDFLEIIETIIHNNLKAEYMLEYFATFVHRYLHQNKKLKPLKGFLNELKI